MVAGAEMKTGVRHFKAYSGILVTLSPQSYPCLVTQLPHNHEGFEGHQGLTQFKCSGQNSRWLLSYNFNPSGKLFFFPSETQFQRKIANFEFSTSKIISIIFSYNSFLLIQQQQNSGQLQNTRILCDNSTDSSKEKSNSGGGSRGGGGSGGGGGRGSGEGKQREREPENSRSLKSDTKELNCQFHHFGELIAVGKIFTFSKF